MNSTGLISAQWPSSTRKAHECARALAALQKGPCVSEQPEIDP
jgi:hypothetical protein